MTADEKASSDRPLLDLDAYRVRIGYSGSLDASRAVLDALHLAHATHIPFENIDVLLGVPIRLDLASVQSKLVAHRRGGYCFEHNRLFASVLETLGFVVTPLAARVRLGTTAVLARTHMILQVDVDGERVLADVGFGAQGLLRPIALDQPGESRQSAWTYRVIQDAGVRVLQSRLDDPWSDLYAFTLEPQLPVDYELANYYTSTNPASRFTQVLIAQRLAPDVRRVLRDRDYTEQRGQSVVHRTLASPQEVLDVLAREFGLRLPRGTRIPDRVAPA